MRLQMAAGGAHLSSARSLYRSKWFTPRVLLLWRRRRSQHAAQRTVALIDASLRALPLRGSPCRRTMA